MDSKRRTAITTHLRNEAFHAVSLGGSLDAHIARTRQYLAELADITMADCVEFGRQSRFHFALADACIQARRLRLPYGVMQSRQGDYHIEPTTRALDDLSVVASDGYMMVALVSPSAADAAVEHLATYIGIHTDIPATVPRRVEPARAGFFGLETLLVIGLLAFVGLCAGVREAKKLPTGTEAACTVVGAAASHVGR